MLIERNTPNGKMTAPRGPKKATRQWVQNLSGIEPEFRLLRLLGVVTHPTPGLIGSLSPENDEII